MKTAIIALTKNGTQTAIKLGKLMKSDIYVKYPHEEKGINVYDLLNEMVESVDPGEQNIMFLPYIFGSNYNPQAKACLIGMDSSHTKEQMARAVFEGIVFCHMVHTEKLLMNRSKPKAVRLAGGAANSKVWVQIFADVFN
ncbi:MAG: FGGY-family carbohydrate kinase, partial [Clostridiales bacterium]